MPYFVMLLTPFVLSQILNLMLYISTRTTMHATYLTLIQIVNVCNNKSDYFLNIAFTEAFHKIKGICILIKETHTKEYAISRKQLHGISLNIRDIITKINVLQPLLF